ncbi:MAG: hypothetical protein U0559_19825 [Anaerolineae bacterium]
MGVVLMIHSIVRWLVVLIGVIAAVRAVMVMSGRSSSKMDRGLMSGFTGLLDLNVLLGVILIIGLGEWEMVQIEHAVTNIIGVAVAHIFVARAKKIDDPKRKAQFHLLGVVVSLLIIVVGVSLVGGWAR